MPPQMAHIARKSTVAKPCLARFAVILLLAAALPLVAAAHEPDKMAHGPLTEPPHDEHGSLAEVGQKLSDPTSNVWALFTEFDLTGAMDDVNNGDPKLGGT